MSTCFAIVWIGFGFECSVFVLLVCLTPVEGRVNMAASTDPWSALLDEVPDADFSADSSGVQCTLKLPGRCGVGGPG